MAAFDPSPRGPYKELHIRCVRGQMVLWRAGIRGGSRSIAWDNISSENQARWVDVIQATPRLWQEYQAAQGTCQSAAGRRADAARRAHLEQLARRRRARKKTKGTILDRIPGGRAAAESAARTGVDVMTRGQRRTTPRPDRQIVPPGRSINPSQRPRRQPRQRAQHGSQWAGPLPVFDAVQAPSAKPWYKNPWIWGGVAVLGVGGVLLYRKRQAQMAEQPVLVEDDVEIVDEPAVAAA